MRYNYWLDTIPGIGDKSKRKLLEEIGNARDIYRTEEKGLQGILSAKQIESLLEHKKTWNIEKEYEALEKKGIHMTTLKDKDYPFKLSIIPDPPFCLYYKGRLPKENQVSVALIGARECSEYGRYLATEIGKELALSGVQIISGMARGIDGIGQMAALSYGGKSFGVLGCGVDICYPKSNQGVYQELMDKGGVISCFPPGTLPRKTLFPPRNRIVSGLCDALLVIEARQKSGTLITVDMALEQGKEVFAVPGRVTDRLSDGCNKLIKEGAGVFLTPKQFVEELNFLFSHKEMVYENNGNDQDEENVERKEKEDDTLENKLEKMIMKELDFYPKSLEEIYEKVKENQGFSGSVLEISNQLMWLCIRGKVIQNSTNWFSSAIANEGKIW